MAPSAVLTGVALSLAVAVAAGAPHPAAADPGSGFDISGNEAVSKDDILAALGRAHCPGPDSACLKAMCDSVAYMYWSLGYMDVRVTCTEGGPGAGARVAVVEGEVSPVVSAEISGASDDNRPLVESVFESSMGLPFSPARFHRDIERVLKAYDEAGYPAARIVPGVAAAEEAGLRIVLEVDEGPRVTIGSVVFEGAGGTKQEVLERETGLRAGRPYDGSRVDAARRRLMALGLFEQVSEPALALSRDDSTVAITFELVEARTSFVEGAVAYAPTPEGGEFYGQFAVDLRNIAGTLRKAGLYWVRKGSGRSAWAVRYREPRLFGLPVGLEGSIDSDIDEKAYERRRLSLRLVQQEGRTFEFSAGWFMARVREGPLVEDVDGGDVRNSYDEKGFDIGFALDRTDRVVNPTRGPQAALGFELSSLDCRDCGDPGGRSDRSVWSALLGGSWLIGLAGRTVGYLGARFEAVGTDKGEVPPSHLIRVGGVNSLRGYPEEWFATDEVLVATAELRYIAGRRSRLYLFIDAAALDDAGHRLGDLGSLLAGYGVGLTSGSRVGVFRVEVAAARGEPLSEAKLHLKLTQRF